VDKITHSEGHCNNRLDGDSAEEILPGAIVPDTLDGRGNICEITCSIWIWVCVG